MLCYTSSGTDKKKLNPKLQASQGEKVHVGCAVVVAVVVADDVIASVVVTTVDVLGSVLRTVVLILGVVVVSASVDVSIVVSISVAVLPKQYQSIIQLKT